MISTFERMLAWRYLRPKGGEGFVSVIAVFSFTGIMLGVATLIIVMSVMNGFRAELFGTILNFNGHMHVVGQRPGALNLEAVRAELEADKKVHHVSTVLEGQAMGTFIDAQARGVMVRGISLKDLQAQKIVADTLIQGTLSSLTVPATVVIGQALAEYGQLKVGDTLKLIAPTVSASAFGFMPRYKEFRVGAIFASGNWSYDMNYVFMPLSMAEKFFERGKPELEVFLTSMNHVDVMAQHLYQKYPPDILLIRDWRETNRPFFEAVMMERNVMFVILTLIVVIAAFNIISGLIMLVKDKTKAIAIMRTMGASRSAILRIFFLTGASIGVLGTLVGAVMGLVVATNLEAIRQGLQNLTGLRFFQEEIYFLTRIPAIVDPFEVMAIGGMALLLTFLATLYPAWKASNLDPIQALRYE